MQNPFLKGLLARIRRQGSVQLRIEPRRVNLKPQPVGSPTTAATTATAVAAAETAAAAAATTAVPMENLPEAETVMATPPLMSLLTWKKGGKTREK